MVKALEYNSKIIAEVFVADNFFSRLSGYMFRKMPHYEAILFKPCSSIHTYFMKFSIDVLFIDENMRVVKKITVLKPGKAVMPQKNAKIVIEALEGRFKDIEEGSSVVIK